MNLTPFEVVFDMSMKTLIFAFIAIFLISGCASTTESGAQMDAQDADATKDAEVVQETNAVQTAEIDPDEVTCKRITKVGTRVKTKVCATNREWQESEKRAQESTKKMQREASAAFGSDSG